ncbi:PREDICTED: interferon-inducible double-stranded RNA-dependent protein kinase activator A homolog B isoform X1 [Bactrocera latifrons]|uniref:Interferon-inducible double stranded RNA-dependent protein kinase activator A A n=1 Tax=Bactrocera latifrons TaxID=174628 RepID=A0A0K8U9C9_BACLA|nr:PREDICTED: interferon-inducible double-stranded RNA-dependent protein kinase activator A homolog B isoform X1 [Bactrocera latifrons]XP_018783262.1 PREDICTED: interferon-inducible double-stranded RNA-dependent protein kinase activator A homolog B isoform X1 [Bactrocera latifrons]
MDNIQGNEHQPQQRTGFAPRRQYDDLGPSVLTSLDNITNGHMQNPKIELASRPMKSKKDRMADLTAATSKLAIEELRLTDSNGLAMKTPVSILQELLSRRGITPNYELVQIEGAIHEPTFRYRVAFNDKDVPFTAMGAGRSKKEAKHSAARALIDKLTGVQLPDAAQACAGVGIGAATGGITATNVANEANANPVGSGDGADKIVGNPIGWLQEMCMSRRWPPPTYETETEVGLPHERLFTIACSILNYREVGKGKSKKIAKRLAAHKMWTRLQENPLDNNQISEAMRVDLDGDNRNCSNYYGDLKDITVPTLTSQHSNKVSQFHKTLKNATGKKLLKLQKTCLKGPKIDYVKLLSEIANENQFEVTYVDIEEKTFTDQCQCLVQLSTLPVGVCHGSGPTAADAQKQAAQNALEYLKIMTKK